MYTLLCPGCGHRTAMTLLDGMIAARGLKERTILALDVACCSLLIDEADYDAIMCPHGRVLDVSKGFRTARPECFVLSYMGDGAAYAIGAEALVHAARRNDDVMAVVVNNGLYAMTGGQLAPTYVPGAGEGTESTGFRAEQVIGGFPIRYLARAALTDQAHLAQTREYLEKAMDDYLAEGGFHLVELLSPCPTNYRLNPKEMAERIQEVTVKMYPLGEFVNRMEESAVHQ